MLPLANMQWIIALFIGSMSQNWTKMGEGGGNTNFSCNYCQCIFKGFYSSMMSHLEKISNVGIKPCHKVSPKHLPKIQRMEEDAEQRTKPKQVPSPTCSQFSSGESPRFTMLILESITKKLNY
jgi:hypothetical protein